MFIFIPAGMPHGFRVGAEPSRKLNLYAPAAMVGYFDELSAATARGEVDLQAPSDIAKRYGMEVIGPVPEGYIDVYAIIDSEKSSSGEALSKGRQRFVDSCAAAKVRCHVLERRALENYFTRRAVRTALGPSFEALKAHERRNEISAWPKDRNWRVAAEMTVKELNATDLGKFLRSI